MYGTNEFWLSQAKHEAKRLLDSGMDRIAITKQLEDGGYEFDEANIAAWEVR